MTTRRYVHEMSGTNFTLRNTYFTSLDAYGVCVMSYDVGQAGISDYHNRSLATFDELPEGRKTLSLCNPFFKVHVVSTFVLITPAESHAHVAHPKPL